MHQTSNTHLGFCVLAPDSAHDTTSICMGYAIGHMGVSKDIIETSDDSVEMKTFDQSSVNIEYYGNHFVSLHTACGTSDLSPLIRPTHPKGVDQYV